MYIASVSSMNQQAVHCNNFLTGRLLIVQIRTSKQHAISMVHFYPLLPNASNEMEALARRHMAPSIEGLMENGEVDDLQHAANWQQVEHYVQTYNLSNLHDHNPFLKDDLGHAG